MNRLWRRAKVADQRTCVDFATCMQEFVDTHYPEAERIRVVLDNLSAHSAAALCQPFALEEARRMLSGLAFHFTPKCYEASLMRDECPEWSGLVEQLRPEASENILVEEPRYVSGIEY